MQAIIGTLTTSIAGRGFVLRRGTHTGDLDAAGVVWLSVALAKNLPGSSEQTRRIGVHSSRFSYLEEPGSAVIPNPRAAIAEQIKAAEAARATRERAANGPGLVSDAALEVAEEILEEEEEKPTPAKRKGGRPRKS